MLYERVQTLKNLINVKALGSVNPAVANKLLNTQIHCPTNAQSWPIRPSTTI